MQGPSPSRCPSRSVLACRPGPLLHLVPAIPGPPLQSQPCRARQLRRCRLLPNPGLRSPPRRVLLPLGQFPAQPWQEPRQGHLHPSRRARVRPLRNRPRLSPAQPSQLCRGQWWHLEPLRRGRQPHLDLVGRGRRRDPGRRRRKGLLLPPLAVVQPAPSPPRLRRLPPLRRHPGRAPPVLAPVPPKARRRGTRRRGTRRAPRERRAASRPLPRPPLQAPP